MLVLGAESTWSARRRWGAASVRSSRKAGLPCSSPGSWERAERRGDTGWPAGGRLSITKVPRAARSASCLERLEEAGGEALVVAPMGECPPTVSFRGSARAWLRGSLRGLL